MNDVYVEELYVCMYVSMYVCMYVVRLEKLATRSTSHVVSITSLSRRNSLSIQKLQAAWQEED